MGVPKTSEHIPIQMKKLNFSQEPPSSSKAPNQDLKDMDVLCTIKIKWRANIWNIGVSKTIGHIQIKIKVQNPSQESPASSEAQKPDFKDLDVLCRFKFKIESQNLEHV